MTGNHFSMVQDEMHRLTLARKMIEVIGRYSISKDSTQSVGAHMFPLDPRAGITARGGGFALVEDE